jgi:hypothetical protein
LEISATKGTMSVLVPGQDDLVHRACFGAEELGLLRWFKEVEVEVWEYIQGLPVPRPPEIFLVTGQTLTKEYKISHFENASEKCVVEVGANVQVPTLVDGNIYLGRQFERVRVSPSSGFQRTAPPDNRSYHSIFLEVNRSRPVSRLKIMGKKTVRLLRSRFITFRSVCRR